MYGHRHLGKFMLAMLSHLEHKWHSSNLSHRGSYSIEKLQAFNEYCQQTSSLQVLCVCLVLPLPTFAVSILVECIPLQNPFDGWKANYGYWMRFFVGILIVGLGFLIQVKQMIPALNLTRREIAFVSLTSTFLALSLYLLTASCWVFPVPFGFVLICPLYAATLFSIFVVVIGNERLRRNSSVSFHIRNHAAIILIMPSLWVVYPAFGAIYTTLPPHLQTFFIIILPIIKAIMSQSFANASRNVAESMPGIVILTVEVFNALYSAKCMQNAGSSKAYAAILLWDIFESVMAFRDIRAQIAKLQPLSHHVVSGQKTTSLLHQAMELCLEPGVLDSNTDSSIRVRSMLKLKTSASGKANLAKLDSLTRALSMQSNATKITTVDAIPEHLPSEKSTVISKSTRQQESAKKKAPFLYTAAMVISRVIPRQDSTHQNIRFVKAAP